MTIKIDDLTFYRVSLPGASRGDARYLRRSSMVKLRDALTKAIDKADMENMATFNYLEHLYAAGASRKEAKACAFKRRINTLFFDRWARTKRWRRKGT